MRRLTFETSHGQETRAEIHFQSQARSQSESRRQETHEEEIVAAITGAVRRRPWRQKRSLTVPEERTFAMAADKQAMLSLTPPSWLFWPAA